MVLIFLSGWGPEELPWRKSASKMRTTREQFAFFDCPRASAVLSVEYSGFAQIREDSLDLVPLFGKGSFGGCCSPFFRCLSLGE